MKIGKSQEQAQIAAAAAAAEKSRNAPAAAPNAAGASTDASAKVALSNTASSLISTASNSSADFDAKKVAQVSESIDDGSYKINPSVIADKLISNARELLGKVTN